MLHKLSAVLVSMGVLAAGGAVQAATLTLFPNSPGVAGVSGNQSTSAPGFGNSSFEAGPTLDGDGKSEIYISATALFGHAITIGEIQSMSYFTNKPPSMGTAVDWSLNIYTDPEAGDTTFYHSHLTAEPYQSTVPAADAPANTWNQWSTNGADGSLTFYDQPRSGTFGTAANPTFSELQAGNTLGSPGTYTWANGHSNNYNNETVEYLSFQTGSAWAAGFNGLLDGFSITAGGQTATVNFEAVPLPSSAWAGLALMAGLGAMKLRGRKEAI